MGLRFAANGLKETPVLMDGSGEPGKLFRHCAAA